MSSVRAAVEPLNTALGLGSVIFLKGSFVGLPLVNQALAREHPLGGNSFFVTLQALIKVLGEIPISAIQSALSAQGRHPSPPTPPPDHGSPDPHAPTMVTCGVEAVGPGVDDASQDIRIFGDGFKPPEMVDIIEKGQVKTSVMADGGGHYDVTVGFVRDKFSVSYMVHAHGETSGRNSSDVGFTVDGHG